ncbi:MAG: TlpA family protein disulfide reductase [Flavobacteriales bacterium]|nr:TlpA family protein disulfide reductase [Flavobacteriales bacterium]
MRPILLLAGVLLACATQARTVLRLSAPEFRDRPVLVQRYMDLFTLRAEPLASARTDAQGAVVIELEVSERTRAQLRIGEGRTDLYLEPGASYDMVFQRLPGAALTVAGRPNAELTFNGLDLLDINALTSDLNERLDAFIAEDLATDQARGMQAVEIMRKGGTPPPDSSARPGTLFITPSWSEARVDTFERKLMRFYAEVNDPWFKGSVEYGVAGLRFGPRTNDKELWARYLKDRPVRYDDPEYVRFFRSFFEDHLMRFPFRSDEAALQRAIATGRLDSVKQVFAAHDFLREDDRLCELVVLTELWAHHDGKALDRAAVRRVLTDGATGSRYPEHRRIATDMLWDLTAMRPGATLPSLTLRDMNGADLPLDSLLKGPVLLAFTAAWCTYCEMEMAALEQLYAEHGGMVTFIGIGTDPGMEAFQAYLRLHPKRDWTWLYAGDDLRTMEALRMRSLPQFLLLQDRTLVHAPAPLPSEGLPAILHRMKVQAEEENKLRIGGGQPPPKPPRR